ncbi:MAG TPA: type II secretion system protein GspG [Gemmataceae bacterium]|nr:type II secretion system protein GspG [Gemmataceae bacterium]
MIIRKPERVSQRRQAFTLMEVMVVVAIILILASVGGIVVFRYMDDAKNDLSKAGTKTLETGCTQYKLKYGEWPQQLQLLVTPPDGGQPYVDASALNDQWGKPYQYNPAGPHNNGAKPDIWTTGSNNQELGNWPGQ